MSSKKILNWLILLILIAGLLPATVAADPPAPQSAEATLSAAAQDKEEEPDAPGVCGPEAGWPGPDGFGYEGSTITYDWVDITTTGTDTGLNADDGYVGPLPVGFTFPFYGTPWDDFYVNSNGFLSFGAGSSSLSNQCPLPNSSSPDNVISLLWDDLVVYTSDGAYVYYEHFPSCPIGGGECLVVEYYNVRHYGGTAGNAGTWEAILYPTGNIIMQFLDTGVEEGSSSTTGIEDANFANDWGLTYACNVPISMVDQTAILFELPPELVLDPEFTFVEGCQCVPQDHIMTITNRTGVTATVELTYTPLGDVEVLGPPDLPPIPNGAQVPFTVTLIPGPQPPSSTVVVIIDALDTSSGMGDTSVIEKHITDGYLDNEWVPEPVDSSTPLYWGASYYDDANGLICYAGGLTGRSPNIVVSNAHQCYDPLAGTWSTRAVVPTPLMAPAYGFIGGKLYMAGGFDVNFTGYNILQIYDPATDSWSTGATMPGSRGGQASGVVNGMLYSAGGSPSSSFPADCPVYEYDPGTDTWATMGNSCPLQGGYGFDLGGSVGSDTHGLLFAGGHFGAYYGWYSYDPGTDTWTPLANMPYHKTPLMVENPSDGRIYSIGGFIGWTGQNGVFAYDPGSDTWDSAPPDLITPQGGSLGPRHGTIGGVSSALWTFGGSDGQGALEPPPHESLAQVTCAPCFAAIEVEPDVLESTQAPDMMVDHTLVISNVGSLLNLDWAFVESAASLDLPEYTPPVIAGEPPAGEAYTDGDLQPAAGAVAAPAAPPRYAGPEGLVYYADRGVFDGDWPGLPVESFDNTLVPPGGVEACPGPFNSSTNNACYVPGAILDGISLMNVDPVNLMVVLGAGFLGNPTPIVGPNTFVDHQDIFFDPPVYAVGFDLWSPLGADTFDVYFYDPGDVLIGQTTVYALTTGTFFGVASDAEPIARIRTESAAGSGELFDDLAFGGSLLECGVDWATPDPDMGSTAPGEGTDVTVTFNSMGYVPGVYTGTLCIESNDEMTPLVPVPVTMTVVPPEIRVEPQALATDVCLEGSDVLTFSICNDGTGDLLWEIFEFTPTLGLAGAAFTPAGEVRDGPIPDLPVTTMAPGAGVAVAPEAPANPESVLWDQPLSGVNTDTYANQDFDTANDGYDIFIADDFTNADSWDIEVIFVTGNTWNAGCDLTCADSFTWMLFGDAGGVPDGDPYGGGNPPLWVLTLPPTDPAVTLTTGTGGWLTNVSLDHVVFAGGPLVLPAGTYWLVFYPSLDYGVCACQSGRQVSDTTNGYAAQVINPGGAFGFPTVWTSVQDAATWGLVEQDFAFRLEGEITAPPVDIPWISEDPVTGTVPPGACHDVDVTVDAAGMAPGDYSAGLEIHSNDSDTPTTTVLVDMTVLEAFSLDSVIWMTTTDSCQVDFDATASGGMGNYTFVWDFGDGFGDVGPSVSHTYDAPGGSFIVTMDVADDCGTAMWSDTVEVTCPLPFHYIYLPIIVRE